MKQRRALLASAVTGVLLLTGAAAVALPTTAAAAGAGCRVDYSISSQWNVGFSTNVTITNLGSAISSWTLTWSFGGNQQITQLWNGSYAQSGTGVTVNNLSYNGSIGTNGTTGLGFNGSYSGTNAVPATFTLNGTVCTGAVGSPTPSATPSSTPPPSPSPSGSPSSSPSSSSSDTGSPGAMAAVAAMQPGWGPGNSLDAIPDETSWGNPPVTKSLFDSVRALGYNSVRIPVTWYPHVGSAPGYTVDPTWMGRVKQVVDWALSDNLYVILNVHHDSWNWIADMTTDPTGVLAEYNALWKQIAAQFQGEPDKLVLEGVNEPTFNGSPSDSQSAQMLNQLNTAFFNDVRQSGGGNATRLLLLPTLGDTPSQALMDNLYSTIQSLHDPNLIASFHYYGYWPFAVNIANETTFDATSQQDMATDFSLAHSEFVARGIPVYAGEIGLLNYDYTRPGIIERGETLKYFEYLGYQARTNGITTNLWDAGSFVNRDTLQQRDPGLFAQIESSWTTRSGTASSDMILLPKSSAITDQTLTLNLDGTAFQGLYQGSTPLANGSDYTVSGSWLTVKAAALTRLLGNRAYGTDATLQARYSQGVPWQINLVSYDTATLSNASATSSSFAIPTQFHGDVLATMEARYADGSAAGTADWTTYQEYWTDFIPDYTNNAIGLTSDFFNAVHDGARVTLTFHFWSGRTATYYVTKSGTSVTGTTN
jgi:endoglucanase